MVNYIEVRRDLNMVAQVYQDDPLLMEGLKFDFRVYVCVTNLNPYTAYVFHDGLARFATQVHLFAHRYHLPIPKHSLLLRVGATLLGKNLLTFKPKHAHSLTSGPAGKTCTVSTCI